MKVGSNKHPIKLVSEHDETYDSESSSAKRKLLHKYTKLTEKQNPDSNFDFKHIEKADIGYMLFFHNIVANSNLPSLSVRVGIALYLLLWHTKRGEVFITTSRKLAFDDYGSLGSIFIGKGNGKNEEYILNEDSKLLPILINDFNIDITYNQLNKTLKNLHQFHYITITGITPDNLYAEGRKKWNRDNSDQIIGKTKFRANIKHINLNFILEDKLLIKKWVSVDEGKRIRTVERIKKSKASRATNNNKLKNHL